MLRNKKGFGGVGGMIFGYVFLCMGVAAFFLRPSHVERRYLEECLKKGNTVVQCEAMSAPLSTEERIDYYRDVATGPPTQNFTHR